LVLTARDEQRLHALAESLRDKHCVEVDIIAMDLSGAEGAQRLIEEVASRKHAIECLINNAGFGYLGDYQNMSSECLSQLLTLNINTLSELTRHYAKQFVENKKGKIMQVASVAAFQPGPGMAAYYASKAYVVSMSQALAYELKDTGVHISILCPGATESDFHKTAASFNKGREAPHYAGVMSAEKVATMAYNGLQKNKLFVIPGLLNKVLTYSSSVLPTALATRVAALFNSK